MALLVQLGETGCGTLTGYDLPLIPTAFYISDGEYFVCMSLMLK